jgi:hypothetical protein
MIYILFFLFFFAWVWGTSVAQREVFTWRNSKKTEGPVGFIGMDYHGTRIFENIAVLGMVTMSGFMSMYDPMAIIMVIPAFAFYCIAYCLVYNEQYYGRMFVNRRKIDSDYHFFGKWTVKNLNTAWYILFLVAVIVAGTAVYVLKSEVI